MGHKKVCLDCKLSLNRNFDNGSDVSYPCPECSKPMILLPHRFRPPKKMDENGWKLVRLLIENGFYFQHIYRDHSSAYHKRNTEDYVPYPTNLRDAKEFIEKYKEQKRS